MIVTEKIRARHTKLEQMRDHHNKYDSQGDA